MSTYERGNDMKGHKLKQSEPEYTAAKADQTSLYRKISQNTEIKNKKDKKQNAEGKYVDYYA